MSEERPKYPRVVPVKGLSPWQSVSGTMGDVLREYGLMPGVSLARIQEVWVATVGEAAARHAQVRSYANGKVFVSVDEPTWRQELSMRRVTLAERLAAALPGLKVTTIVFR